MSSNVNPLNINGAFPVAGQDNDSQGFRDNFTNIRTNLTYAKAEIEDLQSKVVLKSPLTGNSSTSNDMSSAGVMTGAKTSGFTKSVYTVPTISGSATSLAIAVGNGDVQAFTTTGSITISVSGWATSGNYSSIRLIMNQAHDPGQAAGVGWAITFSSEIKSGGSVVTDNRYAVGTWVFDLFTIDGGANVFLTKVTYPGA